MENQVSRFVRFCKGVNDKGILISPDEINDYLVPEKDCYVSTFYYNQEQYNQFKLNGTIRGIKDVVSDKIWFDLDAPNNVEVAQNDANLLVDRLQKYGIKENNIQVFYTGSKGFEVTVRLNRMLTPQQISSIAINKFGKDLTTLDHSLYDSSQILRLAYTKHQKTGLFKIPLSINQIKTLSVNDIKKLAVSLDTAPEMQDYENANPSEDFFYIPQELKKEQPKSDLKLDIDLSKRPGHWRDYKWALLHAIGLKSDERHEALIRVAATCRGLGYSEEITRAFCLTFDENFQRLTGKPPVEDLENNILLTVFNENWEGGQYSYKTDIWLQKYCERIGLIPKENNEETKVVDINNIVEAFDDYALNFDKNIVKTGILEFDRNVMFLTATHNGIIGNPGSGKTSFAIQWLKNVSKSGEHCLFYSLDMAKEIIAGKLIQSVEGISFKDAVKLRIENPKKYAEAVEKIKEDYKNVRFNFTSGTTVAHIYQEIKQYEESSGHKIRLLIVDYLECLQGEYADATANGGQISNQLKDLANNTKVCSVILLQTQKHSTAGGDVSEPLMSLKSAKGSSVIEQAVSVMLTMWRAGYTPKFASQDKFISFAAVKNRFGGLWTDDFNWDGKRGYIGQTLSDEQRSDLNQLLEDKKNAKIAEQESKKDSWT